MRQHTLWRLCPSGKSRGGAFAAGNAAPKNAAVDQRLLEKPAANLFATSEFRAGIFAVQKLMAANVARQRCGWKQCDGRCDVSVGSVAAKNPAVRNYRGRDLLSTRRLWWDLSDRKHFGGKCLSSPQSHGPVHASTIFSSPLCSHMPHPPLRLPGPRPLLELCAHCLLKNAIIGSGLPSPASLPLPASSCPSCIPLLSPHQSSALPSSARPASPRLFPPDPSGLPVALACYTPTMKRAGLEKPGLAVYNQASRPHNSWRSPHFRFWVQGRKASRLEP